MWGKERNEASDEKKITLTVGTNLNYDCIECEITMMKTEKKI